MKRTLKKTVTYGFAIMLFACVALLSICNLLVVNNARGKAFSEIDSIKYNKVGLLLGTTPQARLTKVTNYFFIYRIDAAEQLYKAGKIRKILISGDENSLDGVNEPECMRDSLVARGVPKSAIILDGKGYRTICSVVNANKVYGLKSFTIISQEFHNERALYQVEHLGLNIENIHAYNAKMPKSRRAYLTSIREYFARVKLFWDLLIYKESAPYANNIPQDTIQSFLGRPVVINDSVCEQIGAIAAQDEILSCEDSIVTIAGVKWRINLMQKGVALMTSVQPDDPKMKEVVKYLNGIYGDPYDGEDEFSIKWSSSPDPHNILNGNCTLVHLRRVHSEEGGTFLLFN